MSKKYLRNLSQEEYNDLSKLLYEKQNGKCFICNKSISTSFDDTNILSLSSSRVFRIEDYALCHKKCNVEGIRDAILREAEDNFEFIVGASFDIDLENDKANNNTNSQMAELSSCVVDANDVLNEETVAKLEYIHDYYWETLSRDFENDIKKRRRRLERIVKINSELKRNFGCQSAYKHLIEDYKECNDRKNEERIIKLAVEQFSTPIFAKMLCEFNGVEYNAEKTNIDDLYN